ncbi:MAG: gamma-glutamyltransferase, partial [Bacteroidales bacterium]|nr:gamma-glutamyltransferase [Bacteroidales bacterium]
MKRHVSIKQYYQYLLFSFLIFSLGSCTGINDKKQKNQEVQKNGMVVSAHPEATKIGVDILEKGGNAVDAACAVELGLAVCFPYAGNIGGGGFMVMRMTDGNVYSLDYREKAPMAATTDMYLDKKGNVISGLSTNSHLAVGVPGTVDGVINAHTQFGKLKFIEIIQPAIDLAQKGFPVTKKQADRLNNYKEVLTKTNGNSIAFLKKEAWIAGDTLKQTDLAHTLSLIRDHGRAGFYSGETAQKIVKQMSDNKGLISLRDLEDYRSVWRDPIVGTYKGIKLISMPPPSSGGVALMQLLGMVEPYPIKSWGWQNSKTIHLMVEAERRVYADRAEFLGDPDFYKVPLEELLDKTYIKQRMDDFSEEKASISETIKHGDPVQVESEETTHYSVADGLGNAVSGTTTLNRGFGSKIVVSGAGFFLNNEMDDFSSKPGFPNS